VEECIPAKYTYTVWPFAISEDAGLTMVSAPLTENFPRSPVDLRYRFALTGHASSDWKS
jgi:hypothetical protein